MNGNFPSSGDEDDLPRALRAFIEAAGRQPQHVERRSLVNLCLHGWEPYRAARYLADLNLRE